jgi:hypothetical protein
MQEDSKLTISVQVVAIFPKVKIAGNLFSPSPLTKQKALKLQVFALRPFVL